MTLAEFFDEPAVKLSVAILVAFQVHLWVSWAIEDWLCEREIRRRQRADPACREGWKP